MIIQENLKEKQRRIGITGGIASGKSTITKFIAKKKKIKILDADNYSKELLFPGSKTYDQIINHFGLSIIDNQANPKRISKKTLKKIIFDNTSEKKWIEKLLHPIIKENMLKDCKKFKREKTLILEIPLLFQAKFDSLCTEIWLVKCNKITQKKRLIARDEITDSEADKIINIQSNFENYEKDSTIILNSEFDKKIWQDQINKLI